jgi:hypothetical protein
MGILMAVQTIAHIVQLLILLAGYKKTVVGFIRHTASLLDSSLLPYNLDVIVPLYTSSTIEFLSEVFFFCVYRRDYDARLYIAGCGSPIHERGATASALGN